MSRVEVHPTLVGKNMSVGVGHTDVGHNGIASCDDDYSSHSECPGKQIAGRGDFSHHCSGRWSKESRTSEHEAKLKVESWGIGTGSQTITMGVNYSSAEQIFLEDNLTSLFFTFCRGVSQHAYTIHHSRTTKVRTHFLHALLGVVRVWLWYCLQTVTDEFNAYRQTSRISLTRWTL